VIILKNWPNDMRMSLKRFDVLGMIFKTPKIASSAWDSTLVEMLNSCV
jgi:hypothetical protein